MAPAFYTCKNPVSAIHRLQGALRLISLDTLRSPATRGMFCTSVNDSLDPSAFGFSIQSL